MMNRFACLLAAALIIGIAGVRPAAAAEKLTLLLDWFINPDHAPLIVAQEKGYFKDAGLKVTIIEPSNPNDPPRLCPPIKAGSSRRLAIPARATPRARRGVAIVVAPARRIGERCSGFSTSARTAPSKPACRTLMIRSAFSSSVPLATTAWAVES